MTQARFYKVKECRIADFQNRPSCGGNNCANAFNKQFTASLDNLSAFCGSFTAATNSFAATGTASWAKNCVGTSTDSAAIASKVSSACSCFVPEPTGTPGGDTDGFRFLSPKTKRECH